MLLHLWRWWCPCMGKDSFTCACSKPKHEFIFFNIRFTNRSGNSVVTEIVFVVTVVDIAMLLAVLTERFLLPAAPSTSQQITQSASISASVTAETESTEPTSAGLWSLSDHNQGKTLVVTHGMLIFLPPQSIVAYTTFVLGDFISCFRPINDIVWSIFILLLPLSHLTEL